MKLDAIYVPEAAAALQFTYKMLGVDDYNDFIWHLREIEEKRRNVERASNWRFRFVER